MDDILDALQLDDIQAAYFQIPEKIVRCDPFLITSLRSEVDGIYFISISRLNPNDTHLFLSVWKLGMAE